MSTTPNLSAHKLDPLHFPLHGSRLIEASAGTGKTWTIAALYLRLVLGHGGEAGFARPLAPADILVMTFTRAATRELSGRIRARLAEAARVLRGEAEPTPDDPYLAALRDVYAPGPARAQAAWRLAAAAEGMDEAAVHTIDAWCQRMLREHAFDSGSLFDEELDADEATLRTQAVRDHWRQQVYPLAPDSLERVLAVWPSVEALADDARALEKMDLAAEVGAGSVADCLARADARCAADLAALKSGWAERAEALALWVEDELTDRKAAWDSRKLTSVPGWLRGIAAWARAEGLEPLTLTKTATERLHPEALQALRKNHAPPCQLPPDFAAIPELLAAQQALPTPERALRQHAAARIAERLASLKRQSGSFGFHDMLVRLDRALAGPRGEALRARILAQHPVALIDEFQDTSPLQYRIFERLYQPQANDPATALLLIGDPKQSIYAFRGADIYSYLAARHATQGRHAMLDTNFRSTGALVDVVNHWFARAEARPGAGAFDFRAQERVGDSAAMDADPLPFVPVRAKGRSERLVTRDGELAPMTLVHALDPAGAPAQRLRLAAHCAEQIVQWLNDAKAGFAESGEPFKRLRPADIAVLVRSGTEAQAMQRALRRRGLASVYLSDKDSVFKSPEARDLLWWLQAVAEPRDARRLRTAFATATLAQPIAELERLAHDDVALEERSEQLRALHGLWQSQGVLPMLRRALHQFGLPARWLRDVGGERRLTNFLHLAELLQTASSTLDGEQALVRWLAGQLQQDAAAADEQIVRLESDADLVQIVTIHKSKGLEYPLVCLPFACAVRQVKKQKHNPAVALSDAQGVRAVHLALSDAQWEQAESERLREDLRLFYVALTRARHALWLGFAAITEGNSTKTCTHRSAAGSLLAGDQARAPEAWLAALHELADEQPGIFLEAMEEGAAPCTALVPRGDAHALQARPDYTARFDRHWGIASFSQLVRGLQATAPEQALLPTHRAMPADDEAPVEMQAQANGEGAAQPTTGPRGTSAELFPDPPAVWHRFARGTQVGNFLHEQLEWLSGEGFALEPEGGVAARLHRRCERSAYSAVADDAVAWLAAVAATPLPPLGVPLAALATRLPEMEFWLPAERLPALEIDRLCRAHVLPGLARPALPERALHGMLMGFADLVFEHGGRYWVLDYKSNWLGVDAQAYGAPALAQALAQHRYDVQAALYLLALHRLLRARLGVGYVPQQHLGGALFFFLRGIDGPASGVVHLAPPLALLDALDALLQGAPPKATGAEVAA
ncbi:MAG: exodeoxyribonuclease V subunit beta [Giesbergeria sp.]